VDTELEVMENQIETMLSGVAGAIDVPGPEPAIVQRVKAAVHIEIDEQWLAGHPSPLPSRAALSLAKRAVRFELAPSRTGRARILPSSQALAALAAAAMLVLSVGLIHRMGQLQRAGNQQVGQPLVLAAQERVDLFLEAAQVALQRDEFSESVLGELESIDARLAEDPEVQQDDILQELDDAIREILGDPAPRDGTLGILSWPKGRLG